MVALLADEGMSSRAIAPVVGANYATVTRDIKSVADATDAPRAVKSLDGVDRTFGRHLDKFLSRTTPPPRWLALAPVRAALLGEIAFDPRTLRLRTCTGWTSSRQEQDLSPRCPRGLHRRARPNGEILQSPLDPHGLELRHRLT